MIGTNLGENQEKVYLRLNPFIKRLMDGIKHIMYCQMVNNDGWEVTIQYSGHRIGVKYIT